MSKILDRIRKNSSIESLTSQLDGMNKKSFSKDESYYQPVVDKAGNGSAVIRFLPAPIEIDGDDAPVFVRMFEHGFQGPGGWYIENSRTTLGDNEPDPVSEYNSKLWNTGIKANQEIASKQKRRLRYIGNIQVISDPKQPEKEGGVFKFKFGKKIFAKIQEAAKPQFEDETPVNVIDPIEGANFKLKVRKVEGFPNYDKSSFDAPSPLCDGDEKEMEKVFKACYSLKEVIDPKNFKSYAELKAKLDKVLGLSSGAAIVGSEAVARTAPRPTKTLEDVEGAVDEDADLMSTFSKLAEED